MTSQEHQDKSNELRVTTLQFNMRAATPQANLELLESLLKNAANRQDLIVLPEVFTTGCIANARNFASQRGGDIYQWMQRQAQRLNADICGSTIVREGDRFFNRLLWVKPDGATFEYDKRHLFRMLGEHHRYQAGTQNILVTLKGWRIVPFVCYDLRFPVWMRNVTNYDLAIVVANWPKQRREHWQALLRARAIENLCYVLGCNRTGTDGFENKYSGDSQIYNANGELLQHMGDKDTLHTTTLDLNSLKQYREDFPAFMDRDHFAIITDTRETTPHVLSEVG